jgi:hypothetical protein
LTGPISPIPDDMDAQTLANTRRALSLMLATLRGDRAAYAVLVDDVPADEMIAGLASIATGFVIFAAHDQGTQPIAVVREWLALVLEAEARPR